MLIARQPHIVNDDSAPGGVSVSRWKKKRQVSRRQGSAIVPLHRKSSALLSRCIRRHQVAAHLGRNALISQQSTVGSLSDTRRLKCFGPCDVPCAFYDSTEHVENYDEEKKVSTVPNFISPFFWVYGSQGWFVRGVWSLLSCRRVNKSKLLEGFAHLQSGPVTGRRRLLLNKH